MSQCDSDGDTGIPAPLQSHDAEVGERDGSLSRRSFLGGTAGIGIALSSLRFRAPVLAARLAAEHERLARGGARVARPEPEISPDFTIAVERDTDLLLLDFRFYGFTIDTSSHPHKIVPSPKGNTIVVQFPPQAIGEGTYYYPPTNSNIPLDPAPVLSAVSGPSRLSFSLGKNQTIPLPTMTPADLLDWRGWTLNVAPGAQAFREPPLATTPEAPTGLQTWVECPYALVLSPVVDVHPTETATFLTGFSTRQTPLTARNVTDCWGARLAGTVVGTHITPAAQAAYVPFVAAVWATDYETAEVTGTDTSIVYDP